MSLRFFFCLCAFFLVWREGDAGEEKVVYVYNWAYYLPRTVLKRFEKETGIRVQYDAFESEEVMEAKLLAARSGYDVVFPSAWPSLPRLIASSCLLPLDRALLPNMKGLDPKLMKKLGHADPGHRYAVPYLWGTTGIAYDVDRVRQLVPHAPVDSWELLFNPSILKKLAPHGVSLLDTPADVFLSVMIYLGVPKNRETLPRIEEALLRIRPFVSKFTSTQAVHDLVSGDVCLAQTYSTYGNMAIERAKTLPDAPNIRYVIPKEGAQVWFDVMAIPKDAPHVKNAHRFINFILRPDVIARISNTLYAANAVPESQKWIKSSLKDNRTIYPPSQVVGRLVADGKIGTRSEERLYSRAWTKIKTGFVSLKKLLRDKN